jgi:Mrp family chromosome partitioning ATPase/capsular polysaccharide biosynthesis protein
MEISGRLQGGENALTAGAMPDRESSEETLNLREVVYKLWAQKWVLFAAILVCALSGYIAAELATPIYTAKALVMIKPRQGGGPTDKASLDASIQGGPEAVPTEAIVLQSRDLAKQTIERLHLDRDPEFAPRAADGVRPAAGDIGLQSGAGTTASAAITDTAVVDEFLGRLLVEVEPHSNVISVSFKSTHPATAALVPNTLIDLYLEQLVSEKNKALMQESKRLNDIILPLLRQKMLTSEAERTIYQQYLARAEEARSDIGLERPDAAVISRADAPLKPSFPNKKLMVLAATGLGAGIGLVLVLVIEAWGRGLRSVQQVQTALGVRCLGAIPILEKDRVDQVRARPWDARDTAFGHAVRSIQLKLRNPDASAPRAILVTGALPEEGKTWTAVSLATSLAADGFSVVIVDCDLHRPALHQTLDDVGAPGLTDYFAGSAAFDQIVHRDDRSGVHYVPAGAAVSKGGWRLGVDLLGPLISRLKEDYRFVILDSAPVLAVAETMQLSQIAERTLLIVRWGRTMPRIAYHALQQLLDVGAEVSVVLSMVDIRRAASHGDVIAGAYKGLKKYYGHYPGA